MSVCVTFLVCERIVSGWLPRGTDRPPPNALLQRRFGMGLRVGGVSEDFRKQVLGYGLTTAQILYRMPDHPSLLQTYVWQNYDIFPRFPVLSDFLAFWQERLDGPLHSVTVAHSKLIKPTELRAVDGVFRLH
nr:usg protein [Bradyrhizobium sp. DOA9]